jgi:hypothetical protein
MGWAETGSTHGRDNMRSKCYLENYKGREDDIKMDLKE